MLAFLLLCAAWAAPSAGRASDAHRFLWNQANARMATAQAPAEYAEAAALYRSLLDRGVRNAPLLRNYGTALLLAEAPDAAVDALLRAERHGGTSPDLRRNLELAFAARATGHGGLAAGASTEVLPWTRIPLFWHFQIPLDHRLTILLVLHGALWAAVVLRLMRLRATARGVAVVAVAGLVLFGSSVLVSLHQESAPLPDPAYAWAAPPEDAP